MTHQLPNGYEAVTVPEGASRFSIDDGDLRFFISSTRCFSLLKGTYRLIGMASEIKEDEAREIVDDYTHTVGWSADGSVEGLPTVTLYMNYKIKKPVPVTFLLNTALESFHSLLASLSLNPKTTVIIKKENV